MNELDETTLDRFKVTDQIEKAARRLEGVRRENFVDTHSLCTSCRWSTIVRRASRNERVIRCGELSEYVANDISECSGYQNMTTLSLGQMADIAVLIESTPPKQVGFYKI